MHSLSLITTLWTAYPGRSLAPPRGLNARHTPLASHIAHGPHHGTFSVADAVADGVAHAVARQSLPGRSFWAAGARPIRIPGRASALMLRKADAGLRALGPNPASLLRTAQASLPVPCSHRAPAGQGPYQNRRGGDLRIGLRALGQYTVSEDARLRSRARLAAYSLASLGHTPGRQSCALRA
jgi:hypothetical protein